MFNFRGGEQVLELYDGQTAMLSTKKLIADNVPKLKFSSRGKELFALSESLYGKWLGGGDISLVTRAVALCKEAVKEGYPHAVVKMGFYYDKDYLASDRTEEFRCRVACDYYCKVAYCDEMPPYADDVVPETEWNVLRRMAGAMLIDMLSAAPPSLAEYGNGKYSLEENLQRLGGEVSIAHSQPVQRGERDREKFAETVLLSCKRNKSRAPLFGIISLNSGEIKNIFAPKSTAMKLCGDLNIWIDSGEKVYKVNNTTAFYSFEETLNGDGMWVYFFNNNLGGHRYLSGKQRKDLCELMRKDNFRRFMQLKGSASERGRGEYLFSDDDVVFFIANRLTPLKGALDQLINMVVGDKGWDNL